MSMSEVGFFCKEKEFVFDVLELFLCFRMLHNISTIGPPTNTKFLHPLNIGDGRGVIRVLDNVEIS